MSCAQLATSKAPLTVGPVARGKAVPRASHSRSLHQLAVSRSCSNLLFVMRVPRPSIRAAPSGRTVQFSRETSAIAPFLTVKPPGAGYSGAWPPPSLQGVFFLLYAAVGGQNYVGYFGAGVELAQNMNAILGCQATPRLLANICEENPLHLPRRRSGSHTALACYNSGKVLIIVLTLSKIMSEP